MIRIVRLKMKKIRLIYFYFFSRSIRSVRFLPHGLNKNNKIMLFNNSKFWLDGGYIYMRSQLYKLGVSMVRSDRVQIGLYYFIIFWPDPNPTCLNSDQKILIHSRPNGSRIDLTWPCKIINKLLIIFI
jgi:hypothetical protein